MAKVEYKGVNRVNEEKQQRRHPAHMVSLTPGRLRLGCTRKAGIRS